MGTGAKVNMVPDHLLEDDDIIDYFLDNNKEWVICEYFLKGHCKFGEDCKYMHPSSMLDDSNFGHGF